MAATTLNWPIRVADDFDNRLRLAIQTICARRPEVKEWTVDWSMSAADSRGVVATIRVVAPDGYPAGNVIVGMKDKTVDIVGRETEEEKILFGDPDERDAPVGILSAALRRPAPEPNCIPFRPSWDKRTR